MSNYGNPIEAMASALEDARNLCNDTNTSKYNVYQFPQMWGGSQLGFGGMGTCAMSTAYTTVILYGHVALVFFDGRFAYQVNKPNSMFTEHLNKRRMLSKVDGKKYETLEEDL